MIEQKKDIPKEREACLGKRRVRGSSSAYLLQWGMLRSPTKRPNEAPGSSLATTEESWDSRTLFGFLSGERIAVKPLLGA